jgi:hypothetical protein
MKANTLVAMMDLANRMEAKLALLAALDRDVCVEDCMDLTDQVTTLTHSLHRFTEAMMRANAVNGIDAEYNNLFGKAA